MSDKLPPHSTKLEQEVLALLISQATPVECKHWIAQKISSRDFYHGPHRIIYDEAVSQLLKDGQVRFALLKDRFAHHPQWDEGALEKWARDAYHSAEWHMDDYSSVNVTEYCERLKAYAVARRALSIAIDLERRLYEESATNAAEFASTAALALSEAAKNATIHQDEVPLADDLARIISTARGEVGRTTYPTTILPLDQLLSGGYEPGTLNVIAARRSVGKSAMAVHLAVAFARQGFKTVYLSQEMTTAHLRERFLSMISGVQLRNRYGPVDERENEELLKAAEELKALPLIADHERADITGIRAKAQEWRVKGLMDVLIIDHLQKIVLHRAESTQRALSDITAGLRDVATQHSIPVILMSQIRREGEYSPKIPTLSCLKGSGSIEEDSDTVLLLWPGNVSRQLCGELEKNRLGMTGSVNLFADFQRMKIGTMSPQEGDGDERQ